MQTKTAQAKNTNEADGNKIKCNDETNEFRFDQDADASNQSENGHESKVYVHVWLFMVAQDNDKWQCFLPCKPYSST